MTERTRLISYLLFGLFSAILKKNTVNESTGNSFPHPLVRAMAFFVTHTKEVSMLVFLSVIENIVVLCPSFLLFSLTRMQFLLTTQKSCRAEKNFHNAQSLQENNARSAANQSTLTIVAIQYNKQLLDEVEHDIMNYHNRGLCYDRQHRHKVLIIHDIMRKPNSIILFYYTFFT